MAEFVKNRTTGSKEFFRGTSATQIKKLRTYESSVIFRACCVKKIQLKKMNWEFSVIFPVTRTESVFWTTCHNFHFPCHMRL